MYRKQTLFFIALAFTLGGCFTSKAEVVYLPQKCEVTFPAYPLPKKNAVENLKELAIYTEKLECALDFCINGKNIIDNCKVGKWIY